MISLDMEMSSAMHKIKQSLDAVVFEFFKALKWMSGSQIGIYGTGVWSKRFMDMFYEF